jgi:uncharacterized membrane protein
MGDEAITFNRYGHLPWREVLLNYPDPNQHALFTLVSNFCLSLWGDSEWVFRFPSLFFGVLAVPLAYHVGKSLCKSRFAALTAALLLAGSAPHIYYSQSGRGYALTVFLCLTMTGLAYALIQKDNSFRNSLVMGISLVICGIALVLTLPSNAFFILAVFVAGLVKVYLPGNRDGRPSFKRAAPFLVSFIVTFVLAASYFYTIWEGLNNGIANYSQATLNLQGVLQIGKFLFDPWGTWLFLLFSLGLFRLKENENFLLMLALLTVPLALTVLSQVVGFPRVYIYFLPFLFMVAGTGLESLYNLRLQKPLLGNSLMLATIIMAPSQFYQWADLHYPWREKVSNGTMDEARQVKSYINDAVPFDSLLVFMVNDPEVNILNHYLWDQMRERQKLFLAGKEIKSILLVSHAGNPPDQYQWINSFKEKKLKFSPSHFKKIKEFGKLHIYEFKVSLSKWTSKNGKPDPETVFAGASGPTFNSELINGPKLFGRYALQVKNQKGKEVFLQSPLSQQVEVSSGTAFILHFFAKTPGKTRFIFSRSLGNRFEFPIAYVNPYLGFLKNGNSSSMWEMVFSLTQLPRGQYKVSEVLWSQEELVLVDEPQSYFLATTLK